jgi:hypothetical protein
MVTSLTILGLLTLIIWSGFVWLKTHAGFSFIKTPVRTGIYFLLSCTLLWSLFPQESYVLFFGQNFTVSLLGFLAVLSATPLLYKLFSLDKLCKKFVTSAKYQHIEVLHGSRAFLASKPFDILYQQSSAGIFCTVLLMAGHSLEFVSVLFAVTFLFAHLGLFLLMPMRYALVFIGSAFLLGALLPLVLILPGGVYIAMSAHMLWYVFLGIFVALRHDKC